MRIGSGVLVQEPSRRKDKVRLAVRPCEPFLAFQMTRVDGYNTRIFLARVFYMFWIPQRGLGVQKMIASSREADPFSVRRERCHVFSESPPGILNARGHA